MKLCNAPLVLKEVTLYCSKKAGHEDEGDREHSVDFKALFTASETKEPKIDVKLSKA